MSEIKRIADFESGDIDCILCGKTLRLYFNGGELDRKECCGLVYQTEYARIDLVISDEAQPHPQPARCER